jgi:hypothetical protein
MLTMRYLNYRVYFIGILLFSVAVSFAQKATSTAGTASSLLLRFEPSTRVSGLGGAFTGLADDENAMFYNPAGLAYMTQGIVSLNHTQWFEDIKIDNLLASYNLSRKFGLAAGITHMWMPEIQGRDVAGRLTSPFDVSSSIFTAALAYQMTYGFNAGIALKYFLDNLADYTASGLGFDFGLHLKTSIKGLYTGLVVQNLGGEITYNKEKQKIPLTIRLGLVYKNFNPEFNILADAVKSLDSDPAIHLGLEYIHMEQFSVRVGNQFTWNVLLTPSLGVGFVLKKQFCFNYAFMVHPELGATHRLGFSFIFKSPLPTKTSISTPGTVKYNTLWPPTNVKVKTVKNELIVSWGVVPGAEYNVYSRHASQTTWHKLNDQPLKKTEMVFKIPKVPGKYYFMVNSILNKQESSDSKEVSINVK